MKVTVLGYYGGYPYQGVGTTSYLVTSGDYQLLLDCGSGALLALQEQIDPLDLDAVLLTHYHHDHIADVGVLQYYWQLYPTQIKRAPLPIYGHQESQHFFEQLTLDQVTVGKSYAEDTKLNLGPFEMTFLKTKHPVATFAVRILEKATGKVLVFTADTGYFDKLIDFSRNCDLLITDTNFLANQTGQLVHLTTVQSAKIASLAQVKQLLLSHLPQLADHQQLLAEVKNHGDSIPTSLADKGLTINL